MKNLIKNLVKNSNFLVLAAVLLLIAVLLAVGLHYRTSNAGRSQHTAAPLPGALMTLPPGFGQ